VTNSVQAIKSWPSANKVINFIFTAEILAAEASLMHNNLTNMFAVETNSHVQYAEAMVNTKKENLNKQNYISQMFSCHQSDLSIDGRIFKQKCLRKYKDL